MTSHRFPSLLIVTESPPSAPGGGGVLVKQLLRDYPKANISWWCCQSGSSGQILPEGVMPHGIFIPNYLFPHARYRRIKSAFLATFWAPLAAWHLKMLLHRLNPDIVWAIPHQFSILPLHHALKTWTGSVHVSVHDYMTGQNYQKTLGLHLAEKLSELTLQIYKRGDSRDVISESMQSDLAKRTKTPSANIIRRSVEPEDLEWLATKSIRLTDAIHVAYAGTIIVQKEFASLIAGLKRTRNLLPIKLHLFGANDYRAMSWYDPEWMITYPYLSAEQLKVTLRQCHWALLAMRVSDVDNDYNRFSFPAKFADYLAAGLPIFALASSTSTLSDIIQHYDVGHIVNCPDPSEISRHMCEKLDPKAPDEYRLRILRCAKEAFNAQQARECLWRRFIETSMPKNHTPVSRHFDSLLE